MKIGIIKEGKIPVDHRVPFTPEQCANIKRNYPNIELVVKPSNIRCYTDQEYVDQGITLQEDLSDCDVLFGVKEVPMGELIPDKTYFFFSHTIKKQPYNQQLLKTIIDKNIQLVDYECLTDNNGKRVVAFGRFAGIVGAYNGLLGYGLKTKSYQLKPAHLCHDMDELFQELKKINTTDLKVVLTGGGRVAAGSVEVLEGAGFENCIENDFDKKSGNRYLQLDTDQYNEHSYGSLFSFKDFYENPQMYRGTFRRFLNRADVFIAGAYWDPKAPVLFDIKDIQRKDFSFKVIADITCDIKGSVPTTYDATTIGDPFYDINRETLKRVEAFSSDLTIMSVDNLPCELPRDASESFGAQLSEHVIPTLLGKVNTPIVEKASITKSGDLGSYFEYLRDYVNS